MDRFGLIGISHRRASADELGTFSRKPASHLALLEHLGVDEILHLSTCNRVEVYWVSHDKLCAKRVLRDFANWVQPGCKDFTNRASEIGYAMNGDAVHRHLHSVLCGMKSLVLGDKQIVGQFRVALNAARADGTCGQWLGLLGDEALKSSRHIRNEVDYSRIPTSVPEVAAQILQKRLNGNGGRVTLLGSGEMSQIMAARLSGWKGVSLCFVNRTEEKARALAQDHGGSWQSLENFLATPDDFDHLVSATASPNPLVSASMLSKLPNSESERLVLDLGVPADTDPEISGLSGYSRMDVLEVSRQVRANEADAEVLDLAVRPHLNAAALRFKEKIFQRNLGPLARMIREAVEQRAEAETARWMKSSFAHMSDEDKELVTQFAVRLAEQTVQVPLIALKKSLRDMPMGEAILARMRKEGRRAARDSQEGADS